MNPSDQLKQAREEKGLTFEQISQQTKIPIHYLESIENSEFDKLPKTKLTLMYVRKYAQYLDLPPDPMLELFDQSNQPESNKEESTDQKAHLKNRKKSSAKNRWIWISASIFALIFIIGATWISIDFFSKEDDLSGDRVQNSTATNETKESSSEEFPTEEDRANLELIEPIEKNNKNDRYQVSNANQVEVVLVAKQPTTIELRLTTSNNEIMKKQLMENERVSFNDQQSISIRIDQPEHVDLVVNGIKVEPSDLTEAASYQFELKNQKE